MAPNGAVIAQEQSAKPPCRRARREAAALAFLLAVAAGGASSFSVMYGLARTPSGALFMWSADPADNNGYFAKMRAGYRGDWRTTMLYTSEPHEPVFLFPFHVALGHVAALYRDYRTWRTGQEPPACETIPKVYNATRVCLVIALMMTVYWFSGFLTARPWRRVWAVAFAAFAGGWSGLPWPVGAFGYTPPNTETSVMKSCILFPNFAASLIFYLMACAAFVNAMKRPSQRRSVAWAALAGLGLGWVHPFDSPPLCAIGAVALAWRWLQTRRFPRTLFASVAAFTVFTGGPILQQILIRNKMEMFRIIDEQNALWWNHWWEWARMLDVYLAAAAVGLAVLWKRRRRPEAMFILVWVAVGLAMVNVPVRFQRRMIEGVPMGLAFATVAGIEGALVRPLVRWLGRLRMRRGEGQRAEGLRAANARVAVGRLRFALYTAALLLLTPGTARVLYDTSAGCFSRPSNYYYIERPEADALEWLEKHSDWREAVWGEKFRANSIPYLSGHRVFYGLDAETIHSREKLAWTQEFFSWKMPVEKFRRICRDYGVKYVYFGAREKLYDPVLHRDIGAYDPKTLELAYPRQFAGKPAVSIYRVKSEW